MAVNAEPPVENWEIDELFKDADKNGDGFIDIEGSLPMSRNMSGKFFVFAR